MICGEIAILAAIPISLSQCMEDVDPTFDELYFLLHLLKHRPLCLFRDIETWLNGNPLLSMGRKIDISTSDHGPAKISSTCRRSSDTYRFCAFPAIQFLNYSHSYYSTVSYWRGGHFVKSPTISDFQAPLQNASESPRGCLVPMAPVLRSSRWYLPGFLEFWIIFVFVCLIQDR